METLNYHEKCNPTVSALDFNNRAAYFERLAEDYEAIARELATCHMPDAATFKLWGTALGYAFARREQAAVLRALANACTAYAQRLDRL